MEGTGKSTEGCGHYVPAGGIPSLIEVCLVGFDHFALLSKPPATISLNPIAVSFGRQCSSYGAMVSLSGGGSSCSWSWIRGLLCNMSCEKFLERALHGSH